MVRDNWTNLNGLRGYAVTRGEMPTEFGARAGISINGGPFPEYAEFNTEGFVFMPVKQFLRQGHNEISVKVTRFDDGRFDGTRAAFDIRLFAIDREPIPRP